MKTRNIIIGAVAAGGLMFVLNSTGTKTEACETYQGYRTSYPDAEPTYIFDKRTISERGLNSPEYSLIGTANLKDSLELYEDYCLTIKNPVVPWASRRLVSIKVKTAPLEDK